MTEIKLKFDKLNQKIITEVGLIKPGRIKSQYYEAIFDTGCSMTTMSEDLFNALRYKHKDTGKVIIIGINGESEGYSSVIDYFEIGGINLGGVRVTIGKLAPQFKNSIILGMNILMWYDIALKNYNKQITLIERQFNGIDMKSRFLHKNPGALNLLSEINQSDMDKGLSGTSNIFNR